jgi:hypothetical protein
VYRSGASDPHGIRTGRAGPRSRRRKIAYGAVFGTAALAFVIAVAALTLPELVAGGSVGKNDGRTTLFGGGKDKDERDSQTPQDTAPDDEARPEEEQEQQPTTPEEEQPTTPEEEPPAEEPPPEETAPPGEPLPEPAPVAPPSQP